jgi:NADPH2:quinone reductase
MLVSFGNSSGPVANIDVKKVIQPKGLYFTRPVMGQYLGTKNEIKEGADMLFEKVKLGKVKIEIFKKYKLENAIQAHKDLEARKIIGPAVIIP